MDLTLDTMPSGNIVRTHDAVRGTKIGDDWYAAGVLVSHDRLQAPWPVSDIQQLDGAAASELIRWQPEIIILGTGGGLTLPAPMFSARIMAAGIGFEAMASDAACRTYNVLVGENRAALLALIAL